MKNLKPFIVGSLAGAGLMFGTLNYHVVQSHNGLQLVPRTPQPSLGLSYADIREWDANQWSDRSELARALVAHGSSDLIDRSVVENVTESLNENGGTANRLRSLLNDSRDTNFDAPRFDLPDDDGEFGREDDGLMIPFPRETERPRYEESLVDDFSEDWNRTDIAERFSGSRAEPLLFDSELSDRFGRSSRYSSPQREQDSGGFSEMQERDDLLMWYDEEAANRTPADQRRGETDFLEDALFGGDGDSADQSSEIRPLGSVRRSLGARAARALDRARAGRRQEREGTARNVRNATNGYVRGRIGSSLLDSRKPFIQAPPPALSSGRWSNDGLMLWDDADPFLE